MSTTNSEIAKDGECASKDCGGATRKAMIRNASSDKDSETNDKGHQVESKGGGVEEEGVDNGGKNLGNKGGVEGDASLEKQKQDEISTTP